MYPSERPWVYPSILSILFDVLLFVLFVFANTRVLNIRMHFVVFPFSFPAGSFGPVERVPQPSLYRSAAFRRSESVQ